MCRTFSPYKIRGEYFSLCASTQIKISASHLCLFRDITYWSEQKHRLLLQSKKQEEHHLWRHHGDMGEIWEGWKKSPPCRKPFIQRRYKRRWERWGIFLQNLQICKKLAWFLKILVKHVAILIKLYHSLNTGAVQFWLYYFTKSTTLVTKLVDFGHQTRRVCKIILSEPHRNSVLTMLQFSLNNAIA